MPKPNVSRFAGLKWFMWVPLFFVLDQATKVALVAHLLPGQSIKIAPGLQLIMAHNYGIAFSLFNSRTSLKQWILIALVVGICLYLARWLVKTSMHEKWTGSALVLILGGALGNLWDRLWHGYVVDFIDFFVGNWHWYTFNLADSFITIGALMMVKIILFSSEEKS